MKNKEVKEMLNQENNYNEVEENTENNQQETTPETTEPEKKPGFFKRNWKKIVGIGAGAAVFVGGGLVLISKFRSGNDKEETPTIDDSLAMENLLEVHQTPLLDAVEKLTDTVSNLASEKETEE